MSNDKNIHRSTSRVLDILELIGTHPSQYTQTEICEKLDSPKSSLHPILYTLVARHFLALDHSGRYRIDYSAFQVGNTYLSQLDFLAEVEKTLQELTAGCLETSHFARLAGGDVLYLKKIDSPESIRMTSQAGARIPAYSTALGKALLMDFELSQLKELYPHGLPAITKHTLTSLPALERQLKEARRTGWTYEIEESTELIRCYGVPIRYRDHIAAAVSVAIPVFRYTEEKARRIRELLFESQSKIEKLLGHMDVNFQELI